MKGFTIISEQLIQSLSDITFDPKMKGSINYAKARAAIDQIAHSRKERRDCRNVVIEHLNGKLEHSEVKTKKGLQLHTYVKFNDGSMARY